MTKSTTLLAGLMALTFAACNNAPKETAVSETLSVEDSTAFEVKVTSEDLERQAQELDKEVDSIVNSLNK